MLGGQEGQLFDLPMELKTQRRDSSPMILPTVHTIAFLLDAYRECCHHRPANAKRPKTFDLNRTLAVPSCGKWGANMKGNVAEGVDADLGLGEGSPWEGVPGAMLRGRCLVSRYW